MEDFVKSVSNYSDERIDPIATLEEEYLSPQDRNAYHSEMIMLIIVKDRH